jgi:hypothetical protein
MALLLLHNMSCILLQETALCALVGPDIPRMKGHVGLMPPVHNMHISIIITRC